MPERATLSAGAALAAFTETLCAGRRVLLVGNALSTLPELLLQRGARLLHVCDPDGPRAAQAAAASSSNKLSFGPWSEALPLREGAFDVVLIENLSALDPARALRETRRLLATRGVALIACPNRDSTRPLLRPALPSTVELDYYSLYDAVAAEFQHVRMLGQAPFVGYAIAEFSPEGEVEPVIDSAFLTRGSEEPEYFVALASQQRTQSEAYSLVQLPVADVFASVAGPDSSGELERLRSAERQNRKRISELEAMLKRTGQAGAVTTSLEHKLARQDAWIRELESRAATADERADQAEIEIDELRRELESTQNQAPDEAAPPASAAELEPLKAELLAAAERQANLERELEVLKSALGERERELAGLRSPEDSESNNEVAQLEQQLSERGNEVRRLERDLREAERIGRELVTRLGRSNGAAPVASDGALERRLAQAEADRVAAVWAAEALRTRLDQR